MDSTTDNISSPTDSVHDGGLMQIFKAENESLGKFFDAVFGFFYRHSSDVLFDDSMHYGRQVLISQYEKWHKRYQSSKNTEQSPKKEIISQPKSANERRSDSTEAETWENSIKKDGPTHTTNTATVSRRTHDGTVITESKKEQKTGDTKGSFFDVTNGAQLDTYAWSQTSDDIEVRIPVHESVRKGTQVKVDIGRKNVRVQTQSNDGTILDILNGELSKTVKSDECVWFLSPGQHLSILLEKSEVRWWDRLLSSEDPINLDKIDAERSLSSIPEDERMQIEKAVVDHQREREGKLTSDQEKMASMLEKAWDAEGSPFKGQPFDPSIVKTMTNQGKF